MIALHMLVLNEEELLPKLLNHLKPYVAEMVIVIDDRTTDKSEKLAQSYGAKTYRYNLNHDFGKARNFGLGKITQPWILQIDADEWPMKELLNWCIAFVKSEASRDVDCVSMIRENLIGGQRIGKRTYEWQHRLFRKHLRFVGRIHETVVPPTGRHAVAPRGCKLLHHKTKERQAEADRRYMEWPEQREIVNAAK